MIVEMKIMSTFGFYFKMHSQLMGAVRFSSVAKNVICGHYYLNVTYCRLTWHFPTFKILHMLRLYVTVFVEWFRWIHSFHPVLSIYDTYDSLYTYSLARMAKKKIYYEL